MDRGRCRSDLARQRRCDVRPPVSGAAAAAEAPGTLVVSTNPAGIPVIVDGQPRGVTPLTMELAPGSHELKLAVEGEPRIIPVTITAGSMVAQTIELPKPAPLTGQLMVRTEPPGARVTIDGTPSGTTPLTVEELTPGYAQRRAATDLSSVTQEVTIEPGTTASLVVPMAAAQGVPVSGWISVEAPAEVQVYEDSRLLGTSQSDRIMVLGGTARAHGRERDARVPCDAIGDGVARKSVSHPARLAKGIDGAQRAAVGRGVGQRRTDRRDADRQHRRADRHARSRLPPPGAGRTGCSRNSDGHTPTRVSVDMRKQ